MIFSHPVYVDLQASIALSLAAGGNITQFIAEDTYDPKIQDIANAKLLNIQIINAAKFEDITGLLVPTTPIDARTYRDLGMPYFEIYNEAPSKVGAGNTGWSSLKRSSSGMVGDRDFCYDPNNPPECCTSYCDTLADQM